MSHASTHRSRPHLVSRFAAGAALALALAAAPMGAATYTITTLAEDEIPNGNCTLREALLAATTDSTYDQCAGDVGPDEIVLAVPGTYLLQAGGFASATRELTVRGAAGAPESAYVVDLGGVQRFLFILSGQRLTLENLTLSGGFATQNGGALDAVDSDLALRHVTIVGGRAANGGALSFLTSTARHLELTACTFVDNWATANQGFGGAVEVNFQGAGSATILASTFDSNRIESASGNFARSGAGLSIESFGGGAIELRHLRFANNVINAPSFARGAGAALLITSTAPFLLEDALFTGNRHAVEAGTNAAPGLYLALNAPSATVRRLRLLGNIGGPGRDQISIQAQNGTATIVSDLLVADGDGSGLILSTSGAATTLHAGNLTVTGHPESGLRLSESSGLLRIENSIVFGNATVSGTNVHVFDGTPEIAPETLVGIDPGFVDAGIGDYRLSEDSIAVDAGDAAAGSIGPYDAVHGARAVGSAPDLGALERGAIFADGFERGDLWAWSSSAGAS